MKSYKAVFLDWDDTIGDFHHAAQHALMDIYSAYRLGEFFASFEDFCALYEPHNLYLWGLYGEDKVTKEFLAVDRFLWPIVQGLGGQPQLMQSAPLREMAVKISKDFLSLTTQYFSLLPGAADMVKYLAAKYPLTIVSNGFIEVQYDKIRLSGLRSYFTHVVLSEEVGYQKPNPKIYQEALLRNNLSADDVVMIGDSWGSDIHGAQLSGIDQIWIRTSFDEPLPEGQSATYIIPSIQDIFSIL